MVIAHLVRRPAVKRLMPSGLVVEHQIALQALMRNPNRLVGMHRVEAEVRRQRIGEPSGEHSATRPVQDGEEIHEASTHGNIGTIRRPDVVRATDVQIAQEIGVDPMGRDAAAWCRACDTRR